MHKLNVHNKIILWQVLIIALGTTWLFAPVLNPALSYRITLISQYETTGQPFSFLFRLGDLLSGLLIVSFATYLIKRRYNKVSSYLLLVIGIGMALDPLFTTTCKMQGASCVEYFSIGFLLHATETVITASSLFALTLYDYLKRKKLVSILIVIFQAAYLCFFVTQYATHHEFKTLFQYLYQLITIIWIAWFGRDYYFENIKLKLSKAEKSFVRYLVATWAFINGLLAIVLSLSHIHLLGKIRGIYFAGDTAWLAQHGVVIGVIMLYLSRHLMRGERRARQILLVIIGIEALKYSVITPHISLLLLYVVTFCLLFATYDHFDRGSISVTWDIRIKDLLYMLTALLVAASLTLLLLDRDDKISIIATHSFNNFSQYALHSDIANRTHLRSVLLADTTTAFLLMSTGSVLWILFRPYKSGINGRQDYLHVHETLNKYSNSSEDYFKFWPQDKQYFWDEERTGFVAYKIIGSVAFALADPIAEDKNRKLMVDKFIAWCRSRRLRACFMPVNKDSLNLYKDLGTIQIGASAFINSSDYLDETSKDKWWRWKKNRAIKQGYTYEKFTPPHLPKFIGDLREISNAWLKINGHEEHGFAMGYFDESYLQNCVVHVLKDQTGKIIAFANQLPVFKQSETATIDMLRYTPEANDAMPFLLLNVISSVKEDGFNSFDLGFVPFAATQGPLLTIAKTISSNRFSAEGLEQFKNKFDPEWQENYLAYDGDIGDLVSVAIKLEKAMEQK